MDTRLWRTPRPPWSCTSWSRWTGSSAWPRPPQRTGEGRGQAADGRLCQPRTSGSWHRRGEGGPAPDLRALETSPQVSCSVSGRVSHGRRKPPCAHPALYHLPPEWCLPRGQGALPREAAGRPRAGRPRGRSFPRCLAPGGQRPEASPSPSSSSRSRRPLRRVLGGDARGHVVDLSPRLVRVTRSPRPASQRGQPCRGVALGHRAAQSGTGGRKRPLGRDAASFLTRRGASFIQIPPGRFR